MSRTDLISDVLTIIRNATRSNKEDVLIPYSKVIKGIMQILKDEDYIDSFKEIDVGRIKKIKVYLKYKGKKSIITTIRKISKPSRRIYVDKNKIPTVCAGFGIAVLSTSKGILSNRAAKELGVGGEVICYVW